MKLVSGGAIRRVASTLAVATAATVALTATASATSVTIYGPASVTGASTGSSTQPVLVNTIDEAGAALEVTAPGVLSHYRAQISCGMLCSEFQVAILRPQSGSTYDVVTTSPLERPTVSGIGTADFDTQLRVKTGDLIALSKVGTESLVYYYEPMLGGTRASSAIGATVDLSPEGRGTQYLYNAEVGPVPEPTVTVGTSPSAVISGDAFTYTADVAADSWDTEIPTGTVSFSRDGDPVAGCQNVALVGGHADCAGVAGPQGSDQIDATYSGDVNFLTATNGIQQRVLAKTRTLAKAVPSVVDRAAPIVYSALIDDMVIPDSVGDAHGQAVTQNVRFSVDGVTVEDCNKQKVDATSHIATCETVAPAVAGPHTLTAAYSGDNHLNGPSSGEAPFTVSGPSATVPPAADFGPVTVGATGATTVTVTNSGTSELAVGDVTLSGDAAFTVSDDACAARALEPGATCDVTLKFAPTTAGAVTATLNVVTDAADSPHAVALTGSGVTVPGPVPPVSTPPVSTPVPPATGAVFAPGAKPTITATVPRAGTPTVAVPLSCPAQQTCELDGTVTINTSTLSRSARASAAATATVARFSKVKIAAGQVKTVKLNLSKAFIKKAQKQGIRRIKATLTINTTLGSGAKVTTHQQITVLLPKAAKKRAPAPKLAPHFTG